MDSKPFIETRTTFFNETEEEARRARVQRYLIKKGLPIIRDWAARGNVQAKINQGRWIVECPTCPGGAEFADPAWPFFVCCSDGCGIGPLNVIFPGERDGLEHELLKRPDMRNRNWTRETTADLRRENQERGI